ncbi:hypothetical protein [Bacillus atrophaeus]|uniref:hypothetical protein n=1 Tax=Bacillus atrophaeus TaxID=1452 RepID=UPI001C10FF48|nr:hypothetical protein [Bacillus atrophaeus]MBU5262060.1 hypothetical protein [Bacillus atrophaeus]MCY8466493.1 hypothetical protein [Bacillus atrophaeus]MCY8478952.1 hypothetical protein [Bacillus atrophaeus]
MKYKGKKISRKRQQELLEARSNKKMGFKTYYKPKTCALCNGTGISYITNDTCDHCKGNGSKRHFISRIAYEEAMNEIGMK